MRLGVEQGVESENCYKARLGVEQKVQNAGSWDRSPITVLLSHNYKNLTFCRKTFFFVVNILNVLNYS